MNKERTKRDSDAEAFVPFLERYHPGSLVISILITLFIVGVTVSQMSIMEQLTAISTGFYQLLVVQISLIFWWILSPTAVENPTVGRFLDYLTDNIYNHVVASQGHVIVVTAFISLFFGWINWSLGVIGGVYIGQKLARLASEEDIKVHYPLVLMAGLSGLMIANQGITSPGGLIMSDSLLGLGEISGDLYPASDSGAVTEADQITKVEKFEGFLVLFGLDSTINFYTFLLHPSNIISSIFLLITIPCLLAWMAPDREIYTIDDAGDLVVTDTIEERLSHYSAPPRDEWKFADKLEHNKWFTAITVVTGSVYIAWFLFSGHSPSMTWMLFSLIVVGLLLHRVPQSFVERSTESSSWAIPIGLPFIFYSAIIVLLRNSGLTNSIGDVVMTSGIPGIVGYIYGFIAGLLIPDPGSVWLIVGPSLVNGGLGVLDALIMVMYASGISNLWLGFVFLGVFAWKIDGFSWKEFSKICGLITIYSSIVVVTFIVLL